MWFDWNGFFFLCAVSPFMFKFTVVLTWILQWIVPLLTGHYLILQNGEKNNIISEISRQFFFLLKKNAIFILRLFESLRSSFGSFGFDCCCCCCWLTLSKQLPKSLDALLLLLPFRWQAILFALLTPATLVLLPVILVALVFIAVPVACSISSTWSLFSGDALAAFFTWSLPNGDGISCFKTVSADDNEKIESLKFDEKKNGNHSVFYSQIIHF